MYVNYELCLNIEFELSKDHAHYLSRVMRCLAGDIVDVFNGKNGEWRCQISQLNKSSMFLTPCQKTKKQKNSKGPSVAFAPIKKTRTDFIIEKATELGASELMPVFTANTDTNRVNEGRLQMIAIEAAEQSQRLDVPKVYSATSLEDFLKKYSTERRLLVLDETGTGNSLPEVINQKNKSENVDFLVGPEGGFQSSELDAMRKLPFVTMVGVGPRILRTETAVLAALSCWQAISGKWGNNENGD